MLFRGIHTVTTGNIAAKKIYVNAYKQNKIKKNKEAYSLTKDYLFKIYIYPIYQDTSRVKYKIIPC